MLSLLLLEKSRADFMAVVGGAAVTRGIYLTGCHLTKEYIALGLRHEHPDGALRPASYLQAQDSAVRRPTSVFKCDPAINYTLVTTMRQPSTNTLHKHKTGSRSFSESCFSTKDPHASGRTSPQGFLRAPVTG